MAFLEVLLLIILISINAFFVASEMAFVRSRHTRIDQLAESGNRAAHLAQAALNNPDRYISACQLGITLTTLVLGDVGEQTFAADISDLVLGFGLPHLLSVGLLHAARVACYVIAFAATAFLQTVFGELIPKTWTYSRAETVFLMLVWPMRAWQWLVSPFLYLLNRVTSFVLGLLKVKDPPRHQVVYSEEEIKRLVSDSEQVGVLEQSEEQMIHSVFDFSNTKVEEVMTPCTDMVCIDGSRSIREFIDLSLQHGLSRIPLFENDVDKIFGMTHIRDGLSALLQGREHSPVRELTRRILIVPENKEVSDLLAEFRLTKTQMAIVIDEYGSTRGLVTVEDLVEELVGDISDEYDVVHDHISVQQDGSLIVDGGMPLPDVAERLKIIIKDEEFNTLGGHLFGVLGRAPHVGDEIEEYGCVFRIEAIDRARILKVRLIRVSGADTAPSSVIRVAPARRVRKPGIDGTVRHSGVENAVAQVEEDSAAEETREIGPALRTT